MALLLRIVVTTLVFAAIIGGAFFVGFRLLRPSTSYAVVEETTLIVLSGDVTVLRGEGRTLATASDLTLQAGDRVRTGAGGYAVITYVDGSTTTLDPNTDLGLQRLDLAPGGVVSVELHLQSGGIWNRMERLVDTSTRIEVATEAAIAVAHGAAFRVLAEPSGRTAVEAVLDTLDVEAGGSSVRLDPGQRTIVEPGQQPGAPRPAPPARFALRLDVTGPIRPFLTDSNKRSVGFHPEAEAFVSQIPGAVFRVTGDQRYLYLPEPLETYQVVLKGQGSGGQFMVDAVPILDGQGVAGLNSGLSSPLPGQMGGIVGSGQIQGAELQVRRPDVQFRGSFEAQSGAPAGSRIAVVQRQLRTGARAAETAAALAAPSLTATATALPSPTTTLTATPTRGAGATLVVPTSDPRPAGLTVVAPAPPTAAPASPTRELGNPALPSSTRVVEATPLPVATAPSLPTTVLVAATPVPPVLTVATARPTDPVPLTREAPTVALPTLVALPSIAVIVIPTTGAPSVPTSAPVATAVPVPTPQPPVEVIASPTRPVAPPAVLPTIAVPVTIPTLPAILRPTVSP